MKFTSDTHFGHARILEFCSKTRPFSSTEEMDEHIIKIWNETVYKNEPVYHLGDFSFIKDVNKNKEIFRRLNGRKHLIKGNHDKHSLQLGWDSVQDYKRLGLNKDILILFHYPIHMDWDQSHRGSIHLHGHVHGKDMDWPKGIKALDVGWDGIKQGLWDFDEIIKWSEKQ